MASINDPNLAAELLRECDIEPLEDALVDRMKGRDMNKAAAGVSVFRFFSGDGAGAVSPGHLVGGGNFGAVLDALYDAAPDLIRLVIRRAWERSVGDDDEVKPEKKPEPKVDEVVDPSTEQDEEMDGDISLWNRGQ